MNALKKFTLLASLLPLAAFSRDASEVRPLSIGSPVPDVEVQDHTGKPVSLHSILGRQKSVIIFYRGGWCPYCNRHLQELATIENNLIALGYKIIAISPDSPANIDVTSKKHEIAYSLYSDSELKAASAFGIDFQLPSPKGNLEKASGGKNSDRLPVPSVFLTTADGTIGFEHVDPNFKSRIPAKLLLAAAESLNRK